MQPGGDRERGKEDVETRASPRLALDDDAAVVAGDDAVHHGQAKAGSFAHRLGGEEWLDPFR